MAEFPPCPGDVADALTYSDTTTGPHGETVDPGPRYEEIVDRHGRESVVAQARIEARVDTFGAVIRTLRRVSTARPNRLRFTVDTVRLGCATLIRPQGCLSGPDDWDALQRASVRAVGDESSRHTLIVDTAHLTPVPLPQLHAALATLTGPSLRRVLLHAPESRLAPAPSRTPTQPQVPGSRPPPASNPLSCRTVPAPEPPRRPRP